MFHTPEKILLSTFWDNPFIKRNGRTIGTNSYPVIANHINTVADFFNPENCSFLSLQELNEKYNINILNDDFIEI